MQLSIQFFENPSTLACFPIEGPLQTSGPVLKTKLHDSFETFSTSYHVLLVNTVSEVFVQTLQYLFEFCMKIIVL